MEDAQRALYEYSLLLNGERKAGELFNSAQTMNKYEILRTIIPIIRKAHLLPKNEFLEITQEIQNTLNSPSNLTE